MQLPHTRRHLLTCEVLVKSSGSSGAAVVAGRSNTTASEFVSSRVWRDRSSSCKGKSGDQQVIKMGLHLRVARRRKRHRVSCCSPAAASAGCQNEESVDFCAEGRMMRWHEVSAMLSAHCASLSGPY